MIKIPTRILLVDDEKDFVEMLSMRLADAGEQVTAAYSGQECLEKLAQTSIDVVILDIKMPGMGQGHEAGCLRLPAQTRGF